MRETTVERYLHKQVTAHTGTTRKMKGRINDCDRLVIWPSSINRVHRIHFVETKAPKKGPRKGQLREHERLRKLGCRVWVIDSKKAVDRYIFIHGN